MIRPVVFSHLINHLIQGSEFHPDGCFDLFRGEVGFAKGGADMFGGNLPFTCEDSGNGVEPCQASE